MRAHFRREALLEVGGWDPFNVTEDADLGIRLARAGFRCGTIGAPTFEDAPESVRVWLPQRVRWFKGWLQTWLVHMRDPVASLRELGPLSFLVMQILSIGLVASALLHPFFLFGLIILAVLAVVDGGLGALASALFLLDVALVVSGYATFLALGVAGLSRKDRAQMPLVTLSTPLYWLMLSLAAGKALVELVIRPHHWNKTPHQKARQIPPGRSHTGKEEGGAGPA